MADEQELDEETRRRRDVVLEFINRKPIKPVVDKVEKVEHAKEVELVKELVKVESLQADSVVQEKVATVSPEITPENILPVIKTEPVLSTADLHLDADAASVVLDFINKKPEKQEKPKVKKLEVEQVPVEANKKNEKLFSNIFDKFALFKFNKISKPEPILAKTEVKPEPILAKTEVKHPETVKSKFSLLSFLTHFKTKNNDTGSLAIKHISDAKVRVHENSKKAKPIINRVEDKIKKVEAIHKVLPSKKIAKRTKVKVESRLATDILPDLKHEITLSKIKVKKADDKNFFAKIFKRHNEFIEKSVIKIEKLPDDEVEEEVLAIPKSAILSIAPLQKKYSSSAQTTTPQSVDPVLIANQAKEHIEGLNNAKPNLKLSQKYILFAKSIFAKISANKKVEPVKNIVEPVKKVEP
ncbi:MAG: hypothetical protein WCG01_05600, partial [bacterium]